MAKWGEGDPRWIVEERPDAVNPNNWHWTEKNATPWSLERFDSMFKNCTFEKGSIKVTINDIKKSKGEATANNRKGKVIFFYEWEIELKFQARVAGSDYVYEGTIEIPNLSDENDKDDIDFNIDCAEIGPRRDEVVHLIRTIGVDLLRSKVGQYITDLKENFGKGMVLPTKKSKNEKTVLNDVPIDKRTFQNEVIKTDSSITKKTELSESEKRELTITESFKLPPAKLYQVFTEPEMIQRWSNSPCEIQLKTGGNFSLFKGMVSGKFIEVVPNVMLKMDWRLKSYPNNYYADVTFKFFDENDSTRLKIIAKGVPAMNHDETEMGFRRHYIQNIMRTFGLGASLF